MEPYKKYIFFTDLHTKYFEKVLRLKLYLPRQKWTMKGTLIFFEIVSLTQLLQRIFHRSNHLWNSAFDFFYSLRILKSYTWQKFFRI